MARPMGQPLPSPEPPPFLQVGTALFRHPDSCRHSAQEITQLINMWQRDSISMRYVARFGYHLAEPVPQSGEAGVPVAVGAPGTGSA